MEIYQPAHKKNHQPAHPIEIYLAAELELNFSIYQASLPRAFSKSDSTMRFSTQLSQKRVTF
jgi:hypothetical protein